ncbi:BnaCnng12400D [Brassica napus]|uniref:BnaCnng12400D protein n=1 Tax=Brassica napus TaxID=3708 RepID=A0A078I6H2_BRANA|nr:BnaCnng12400D [Brassica napus]
MDINEPSLMDVAHDTINSTQGPALIEVAYFPSSEGKGQGFFRGSRRSEVYRHAIPSNTRLGAPSQRFDGMAHPIALMSYGNSWLETILMVLISGRNNKNQSPGSLNAELLTLLVRMGVHPKVFPDCMHTSVLGLRSVHMSSLRCLHRNQNLFSILSRVRIAPPNFLVGRAVVELRQVLRVTLLLVFLAGMPIVPCDNYSWRKGWATRWAGQSLLLEEIDLTCYRTESSAGTGFSKAESFFALINEFISFFALLLCLREAANIDAREGGEGEEWIGKSLKGTKFFLPSSLCIV